MASVASVYLQSGQSAFLTPRDGHLIQIENISRNGVFGPSGLQKHFHSFTALKPLHCNTSYVQLLIVGDEDVTCRANSRLCRYSENIFMNHKNHLYFFAHVYSHMKVKPCVASKYLPRRAIKWRNTSQTSAIQ